MVGRATVANLILSGDVYEIFINAIKSETTRHNYIFAIKKYMQYRKVTKLEELLPSSLSPNQSDIHSIESDIIKYIIHLKNVEKNECSTITGYLAAIMLFYAVCTDLNLNRKKISRYLPASQKAGIDRGYTTEEIAKMLSVSDARVRALILLLASTGMRIGGIADRDKKEGKDKDKDKDRLLRLKHLHKFSVSDKGINYNVYKVVVYEGCKEEYFCFTTPEATKAIDAYLEYRERYHEKLTPESYLFREQFNTSDPFDSQNPKGMQAKGLSKLIAETAIKSGVTERNSLLEGEKFGSKRHKVFNTHGFRKFVTGKMVEAGLSDFVIDKLLGHKSKGGINSKHYYRPQEDELFSEYLKAIDYLTIDDSNRLRLQVEQLTIKKSELEELREELQEQKKQVDWFSMIAQDLAAESMNREKIMKEYNLENRMTTYYNNVKEKIARQKN